MSSRHFVLLSFLVCLATVGCSETLLESAPRAADLPAAVSMDPSVNGAATADSQSPDGLTVRDRKLDFIVQADGRRPLSGSDAEQRLSMSQAAVVEALGAAVAKSRKGQGQSSDRFTAPIGRGVTMNYQALADESREVEISAAIDGRTVVLHSSDGHLTHPPCDPATLDRIIRSTQGRYALLSCEPSIIGEECTATIACYKSAGRTSGTTPPLGQTARN